MKPVTDAEVVCVLPVEVSQMQGRSLEVMAPAITRYLTEQQEGEAARALVTELRKGGPAVRVMIDSPRFEIDALGHGSVDSATRRRLSRSSSSQTSSARSACSVAPTMKQIRATYGDKVRIVWKDFPLTQIHPQAFKAGEAGHCAAEQGKFWEFHDQVFENQQAMLPDDLKRYAAERGPGRGAVQRAASTPRNRPKSCATAWRRALAWASTRRRRSSSTAAGWRVRSPTRFSPP